jgi:hypothetical protein
MNRTSEEEINFYFFLLLFFAGRESIETGPCYVAQAGLNLESSCLSFLSAGITLGMSHHDQLNFYLFYTFPVLLKVHTT